MHPRRVPHHVTVDDMNEAFEQMRLEQREDYNVLRGEIEESRNILARKMEVSTNTENRILQIVRNLDASANGKAPPGSLPAVSAGYDAGDETPMVYLLPFLKLEEKQGN